MSKKSDDVMLATCYVIVFFFFFSIYGQFAAIQELDSGWMVYITYILNNNNLLY